MNQGIKTGLSALLGAAGVLAVQLATGVVHTSDLQCLGALMSNDWFTLPGKAHPDTWTFTPPKPDPGRLEPMLYEYHVRWVGPDTNIVFWFPGNVEISHEVQVTGVDVRGRPGISSEWGRYEVQTGSSRTRTFRGADVYGPVPGRLRRYQGQGSFVQVKREVHDRGHSRNHEGGS